MTHFHVFAGANDTAEYPEIRKIGVEDVFQALKRGIEDFARQPSHILFLGLIYPVTGIFLAFWASGANLLPLVFPLMAGVALVGPFAAIGLYVISRRREAGLDSSWRHVFGVLHSPSIPSILAMGLLLVALFAAWLFTAQNLYLYFMGEEVPASISSMLSAIFTTGGGWRLMAFGNLAGLGFALAAFCLSVISFPLLIDRDVGAAAAIVTSLRAVQKNVLPMLLWGLIVALCLIIGFALFFVGLAIAIPVLGHATWHLYRAVVVPVPVEQRNEPEIMPGTRRSRLFVQLWRSGE